MVRVTEMREMAIYIHQLGSIINIVYRVIIILFQTWLGALTENLAWVHVLRRGSERSDRADMGSQESMDLPTATDLTPTI